MTPLTLVALAACDDRLLIRTTSTDLPRRETFEQVGTLLLSRCGSIDCHGAAPRSFRLYGFGSRRLSPDHFPDDPATTAAELTFDYEMTVSVEPELVRRVARGEEGPDALTIVRKARGSERHIGGGRMPVGSLDDRCFTSWLVGREDSAACAEALVATAIIAPRDTDAEAPGP